MNLFSKSPKQKHKLKTVKIAAIMAGGLVLASCSTIAGGVIEAPFVAKVTETSKSLRELPAPKKRIAVAVYSFNDLTGQYKESATSQSLSRAVTQGGAAILVKALQDAGERRWFTVLERSNLDNLLKERQIVTEMRRLYRREQNVNPNALPPLRHAAIIIEGGIIGYSTNTVTGGAGAGLLGLTASAKYAKDEVTVSLRAVSTKTGEVLASVTARKAIASTSVQAGLFRYIRLDKLAEAEIGVTSNEPRQIAVEAAVEKAVQSLIVEGAETGIWRFANKSQGASYITDYKAEKYSENKVANSDYKPKAETKNASVIRATIPTQPRRVSPQRIRQAIIKSKEALKQPATPPPAEAANEKPVG